MISSHDAPTTYAPPIRVKEERLYVDGTMYLRVGGADNSDRLIRPTLLRPVIEAHVQRGMEIAERVAWRPDPEVRREVSRMWREDVREELGHRVLSLVQSGSPGPSRPYPIPKSTPNSSTYSVYVFEGSPPDGKYNIELASRPDGDHFSWSFKMQEPFASVVWFNENIIEGGLDYPGVCLFRHGFGHEAAELALVVLRSIQR